MFHATVKKKCDLYFHGFAEQQNCMAIPDTGTVVMQRFSTGTSKICTYVVRGLFMVKDLKKTDSVSIE